MRRPAALILAASFLFTLSSLLAQDQTSQAQSPSPEKSAETGKSQSSDKTDSSLTKPGSTEAQQSPSNQTQSPNSEKSAETEKSQGLEKAKGSTTKTQSAETQENPFDKFQQFSAVLSGGPFRFDKMPIYRSGKRIRSDWAYEHEIRITDFSTRLGWFERQKPGMPEWCGPMTMMDISSYPFFAYTGKDWKVEHVAQTEPAEEETIDGHPTKIQTYTVTKVDGGLLVAKVRMWEAEDLKGFPLRMEIDPPATKKTNLYYSNVSLAPPDPKLFQLPAKCMRAKEPIMLRPAPSSSKTAKPATSKSDDKSSAPPQ